VAAALTVVADGAYRLHLVARTGNARYLRIGLRSASRPYPVPADCVTRMGRYVLTTGP
jgi:hypothetical protein